MASRGSSPAVGARCAVVTGAGRGIGLELVRQLAARGDRVFAVARRPAAATALTELAATTGDRVTVIGADVTSDEEVAALATTIGDQAVDVLINNAGVYGGPNQSLANLDLADCARIFEVNALGPLRVTRALLPQLRRRAGAKLLHVTSGMGSIGDNTSGGDYGYRMSKAALNMASKSLAVDLRRVGICSAVINPGWVQTDMGGPNATTTVEASVAGILRQLDLLSLSTSGTFLDWSGASYPW
ncbi:MAG: SDR family oxidoreductase [Kofleriaceae bacterium]